MNKRRIFGLISILFACLGSSSVMAQSTAPIAQTSSNRSKSNVTAPEDWLFAHVVDRNIRVKDYFKYVDKVVKQYDTLLFYRLTPHLLARMNPWIIDNFVNTDYYQQQKKGVFIFDQQELVILKKGDTLFVKNDNIAFDIIEKQNKTYIDVNVPEYKLQIIEDKDTVGKFLIRVGRNSVKQWAVFNEKVVNLRTKTGHGKIVSTYFKTASLDPATGRVYYKTNRDDGKVTMMPLMPWVEPEINKERFGQLIHPTTNETSLGKAFSNGCMGAGEGDMWRIFFYAPVGTRMQVRYDLDIKNEAGEMVHLKDIYGAAPKKEAMAKMEEPKPEATATKKEPVMPKKEPVSFKSTPKKEVITPKTEPVAPPPPKQ